MARAPKKEAGTAVVSYKEQLKQQAAKAAEMEKGGGGGGGGGKFFSMRAGVLAFDDVALPGNQIACVIADSMLENVYYEERFDPDASVPPTCFAFGRDAGDMAPHEKVDEEEVFERQADNCSECPMNEWGSADTGKGKACGNRRRLAIIPAGTYSKVKGGGFELELFDEAEAFKTSELAYMKLPVTSVKAYSKFVREASEQLELPPHGVITRIYLEPDAKSQFKVHFEILDEVPEEFLEVVMKRHEEASKEIDFPYQPRSEEDEAPADQTTRRASANKKLTGGRGASASKKPTGGRGASARKAPAKKK